MKYLKLFENTGKNITMTKVTFFGGNKNLICLYIDGELFIKGDWYNGIETKIHGFIDGVKWCGNKVNYERLNIHNPLIGNGEEPPQFLSDVKKIY